MQSLDSFLERHVESLVAGQKAPIDLAEVARQANAVVEEREMIPEAAMAPDGEGFRIYVQCNFLQLTGARTRQRFSFSHEIAHTFFFELRDGVMKPRRDAPTGARLEAACQKGAGLLLVPTNLLRQELRQCGDPIDAAQILRLAHQFDASVEVTMRRLYDVDAFGSQFAPVLVRRDARGNFNIEFGVYPPWVKALFPHPRRGTAFTTWFGHTSGHETQANIDQEPVNGVLVKGTAQGTLMARPVDITPSLRIFELRLQPG